MSHEEAWEGRMLLGGVDPSTSARSGRRLDEEVERALGATMLRLLSSVQRGGTAFSDTASWTAPNLAGEGARLVPGTAVAVCACDAGNRNLSVVATSGAPLASLTGSQWPRRGSILQRALETRTALETSDLSTLTTLGTELEARGATSVRAVPLLVQVEAGAEPLELGVYLSVRQEGAAFSAAERRRIDTFAPLLALTVLASLNQVEQERQAQHLSVAVDVAVDLASAVTPGDVNHRILVRTVQAADADRAILMRIDNEDLVVEDAYDRDGRQQELGRRVRIGDYPAMVRALATRRPERLTRELATRLPESTEQLADSKHTLVTPLVFAGEAVGLLTLHRRHEPGFSESDLQRLQLINNLAVLALRNSRLTADAHAARAQMSEFLDVVVHDLRSPLTVVSGYASMMRDGVFGAAPASWVKPLEIIAGKTREAQRLVDELLLAARLESGDIPTREQALELGELARGAVDRAEPRAQMEHATIVARSPSKDLWVRGDRAHAERILDNLVNNALSYGGNPPEIEVSVIGGEHPGIAVTDHGAGIPEDKRGRIFERFFRGHEGSQGSGLGLYVSRRLAEANRGTLNLDSRFQEGTRFELRLPARNPG